MESNYIPKGKIKRQYDTIYVKSGDCYKTYRRNRHWFKKDEWIYTGSITESDLKYKKFRDDYIMLSGYFDHYNLVIDE